MQMIQPNLFIVGAPKAGTTSLYAYLEDHPDVYMSPIKETNYFTYQAIKEQGLYYKEEHISTLAQYQNQFQEHTTEQVIGEASVSYLFYPGTAKKLHDFNPNAKIVMVLRQSIDRGFSHYLMDSRLGFVDRLSFEDIIFQKSNHPQQDLYYQQFIELGLYYEQVKQYYDYFDPNQIKVFLFEDLKADVAAIMQELYDFLEIDASFQTALETTHNPFLAPRNAVVGDLYKQKWIRNTVTTLLPAGVTTYVKSKFFDKSKKPILLPQSRSYLNQLYQEDWQRLAKLINRNLDHWNA